LEDSSVGLKEWVGFDRSRSVPIRTGH
jgi:hypothetical protein